MAEQTFRSPNFFDREIDLSAPVAKQPSGVPVGVIGTSNRGPAFVPVTVADFSSFISTFGNLDPNKPATYAVEQVLNNKGALTFMRVLGAGANSSSAEITNTLQYGTVTNAGFTLPSSGDNAGAFFIVTKEQETVTASLSMPLLSDNDTITDTSVQPSGSFVRAVLMLPTGSRAMIFSASQAASTTAGTASIGLPSSSDYTFKLAISSSLGSYFSSDEGIAGMKIYTVSLNPTSQNYISKVLNTDSTKFADQQHLLYAHFPVDHEIATPLTAALMRGSNTNTVPGPGGTIKFRDLYTHFKARYSSPRTPSFISQPFGDVEHDLFHIESLDDGAVSNSLYKISIANVKASVDPQNPYGTFSVQVRDWNDTDFAPRILEQFNNCDLNPQSSNYVAKIVGDRKVSYNFDADNPAERRLIPQGNYPNNSSFVRVVVSEEVANGLVPKSCVPFGFRGPHLLKTTDLSRSVFNETGSRLVDLDGNNCSPVVPPIPYRVKLTRGPMNLTGDLGDLGPLEILNANFYWGVKFERNNIPGDNNSATEKNALLQNLTKFMGVEKLGTLVTGSSADTLNNNKFTLARVTLSASNISQITDSADAHMKYAAYYRNGVVDPNNYTITRSGEGARVSFASLLNAPFPSGPANFNRFAQYTKFSTFMYGGFDGVNLLDRDAVRLNDKSTSLEQGGGASDTYTSEGFTNNPAGAGAANNSVSSYHAAADIMTDPFASTVNVLAVPGIREPYVTDYVASRARDYGLALYVMDIPAYADNSSVRIYDDTAAKPNIENTASSFESRAIDNSYTATYFPDVFIDDATNRRRVKVPASVAALSALGFNDRVSYPWFAPAGFNRAALDFVTNVQVRLNITDRDRLYDARINPIATFPRQGYVIYGQKTLQVKKSALDRVNVRRLMLEIKRIVVGIAQNLVFEQNTPAVRNKFVADSTLQLSLIQAQAGIEAFQVVMNETNNTQDDIINNRLRGRIVVVPTRVVEFIAIDFVVTNSGVQFV